LESSSRWSKPELIILGRGAPEENVLCYCKTKPSACGGGCSRKQHRHFVPSYSYHTS
jgi:hypothetical protein